MNQAETEHVWHTGFTLDNSVCLCVQVCEFICIGFWVYHCECVRVKVQVCASDFLQGNFVSQSSWLTSLVDLGVSRISVEIKKTNKESERQTLLSSVFTVFYKV